MNKDFNRHFFQRRHIYGQELHEKILQVTNHQGTANQNHNEILLQNGYYQRDEITCTGENMKKMEYLCTVGRNVKLCSNHGKHHGGSSKKLKLPYVPAIPLLG